jgi:predicted N-acetyltransferase YhbS
MKSEVQIIKGKKIPSSLLKTMNNERIRQYGKKTNRFKRKYHKETNFFLVKNGERVVSFGFLRPVKMNYKNKDYDIFALGGIMVVEEEKGKGYGAILIKAMVAYSKKSNKTSLGFCGDKVKGFYKKVGLKVKKDFSVRLEMENPKTKERIPDVDGACPGIYYEGKDKFISKLTKTKGIATYWMEDIKEPHF